MPKGAWHQGMLGFFPRGTLLQILTRWWFFCMDRVGEEMTRKTY